MSSLSKEAILVHAALEAKGLETPLRGAVLDSDIRKQRIQAHIDRDYATA
ncbi:hypothetical protein [Budvicia aquatica]|uniref:GTP cyclohydrolase 1 n=1 Tax=Budvicia aquatica TaxID=82979 RepID=A0A484ZM08_9GAMM|nr:hypothetical protein [Budvicia aquatica]VFS49464.1 GTP cyclohydrolase 1 [Budvicia aquatica]